MLSFLPDGTIEAENTDATGLIMALGDGELHGRRAMVLGAGGTARAAAWALSGAGADVAVWNRTPERAQALAKELGVRAVARPQAADLLVNTTTVGMDERLNREAVLTMLGLDSDMLRGYAQIVDFVYRDTPTPLLIAAHEQGAATLDGVEILVAQGALSFQRWTGCVAPLDAMRRAAEGDS
jgi:shikimate dehydrogenase